MSGFRFIGQPEETKGKRPVKKGGAVVGMEEFVVGKKGDGPDTVTRYGYTFKKGGAFVDVDESTKDGKMAAAKLRAHSHFEERTGRAAEEQKAEPEGETTPQRRGPGRPRSVPEAQAKAG